MLLKNKKTLKTFFTVLEARPANRPMACSRACERTGPSVPPRARPKHGALGPLRHPPGPVAQLEWCRPPLAVG